MSEFPFDIDRTASPGTVKQVAFDHKCQVIPEGDCAELRKLLSLNPTRAQSPPIAGSASTRPASLIARAISPQFARSKSPQLRSSSTSWKTRLTSWSSHETAVNSNAGNLSAATPAQSSSTGPRLVAPVPARSAPLVLAEDVDDSYVHISPSEEKQNDLDDIHAEFQQAISGFGARMDPGPSSFHVGRPYSPFALSVSELRHQRSKSAGLPKSCLIRSRTPQAPGPPHLMPDGMNPLRASRSNDQTGCFMRRRRADGVPVVCPDRDRSPLSSPEDERGGPRESLDYRVGAGQEAKGQKQEGPTTKRKLSIWRQFRRAASEDPARTETSSLSSNTDNEAIKREIAAGRWPFEAPLNVECSCKNCQEKIEVGLASDYEPKWTRAARIRWLEAQEDATSNKGANSVANSVSRSTSRIAIQADEVAQLHNETAHPMTSAELAEEQPSPVVEQGEPLCKPRNSTGLDEGDDTLRREIMARRQSAARSSPVLRHGARSMMRQLEEAERREEEAARIRARGGGGGGSGRSSPASLSSTPELESTSSHEVPTASSSYFEHHVQSPPERVRSPLIPADAATKSSTYARPAATESFSMGIVAQSLEDAVASPDSEQ